MKMTFKGGGPLDGDEIETTFDVIRCELEDDPGVIHVYRAIRHRPFAEDPADHFVYHGVACAT